MRKHAAALTLLVTLIEAMSIASATAATPRVRTDATLSCDPGGGARVTFTILNPGRVAVVLDPDFHLLLELIRRGRQPGVVLFVFPAPDFAKIPAGERRTFLLDMGTPDEGFPGIDLSGARLLLESEVWLRARSNPIVRTFTFPGCEAPREGA